MNDGTISLWLWNKGISQFRETFVFFKWNDDNELSDNLGQIMKTDLREKFWNIDQNTRKLCWHFDRSLNILTKF